MGFNENDIRVQQHNIDLETQYREGFFDRELLGFGLYRINPSA